MEESLFGGVLVFGILQSLFFALLFFTKKKKALPDAMMGVWLVVLAFQTLLVWIQLHVPDVPMVRRVSLLTSMLYGSLLFQYVSSLICPKAGLLIRDAFHLIPFAVALLALLVFPSSPLMVNILAGASVVSAWVYCWLCLAALRSHRKNIQLRFSNHEKINLRWLNRLLITFMIIWLGVLVLVGLHRIFKLNLPLNYFFTLIPLFIFYIAYYGIRQEVAFERDGLVVPVQRPADLEASKSDSYKKSGLQSESMARIHSRLLEAMQKDRLYLNPTLTLADLSEWIHTPSHQITQSLNVYAQINFYDFVNGFRVEAFKQKIQSGEASNFSLLGIAYDCGFNSKSSFNRIFKQYTGDSPSEFKNKQIDLYS